MVRLLLIEDETDNREMLAMLLEAGGYSVTSVDSQAAALRALHRGGFDIVIADFMLGRHSTDESWRNIDQIVDAARPAPVGMLSAWHGFEREAPKHGVAFALRKPSLRDALFAQLAETLRLPPLTSPTVEKLRGYFDCIEAGTYDQFRSLLPGDFVYRLPGTDPRFSKEVRGLDEFIAFTAHTFEQFEEPRFEIGPMRPLPRGALVEYVGSWREGGARREMPGAVMFELDGGHIQRAEVRVNVDALH